VGVLSAPAATRNPPHIILTLVSQRFGTGGRRCSVRPHTVRRPRLALNDGAATQVGFFGSGWKESGGWVRSRKIEIQKKETPNGNQNAARAPSLPP